MKFKGPFPGDSASQTSHENYGTPMKATRKRLGSLGRYESVPWGHYAAGTIPIASFGLASCRGFVLQNHESVAVAHIYGFCYNADAGKICDDPLVYIDGMLRRLDSVNDVRAAIISPYKPSSDLKEACAALGVPFTEPDMRGEGSVDIIARPDSRQIEIFTTMSETALSIDTGKRTKLQS